MNRAIVGSSPHARGTLGDDGLHGLVLRFIPACAGNAPSPKTAPMRTSFIPACAGNAYAALSRLDSKSVHPRMRGERTSNKLLIYRRKSEPSDSTKHSGC